MNIEERLLPTNKWNRPCKPIGKVLAVVVHWTACPRATAKNIANYFEHQVATGHAKRYAGAHYVIGMDGEIIRCIPEDEMTYHCGARRYTPTKQQIMGDAYPNAVTLGIELCHLNEYGKFYRQTLNSAVELVADLCKKYGLDPKKQVLRHYDVTLKNCPKYFVLHPAKWDEFLQRVREAI